jgi:hypothetical protein
VTDRRQRRRDQRRHKGDALTGDDSDAVLLRRLEAGRRDRNAVQARRDRDAIRAVGLRAVSVDFGPVMPMRAPPSGFPAPSSTLPVIVLVV